MQESLKGLRGVIMSNLEGEALIDLLVRILQFYFSDDREDRQY